MMQKQTYKNVEHNFLMFYHHIANISNSFSSCRIQVGLNSDTFVYTENIRFIHSHAN